MSHSYNLRGLLLVIVALFAVSACSSNKDLGDSNGMEIGDPTLNEGTAVVPSDDGFGTASSVGGVDSSSISGIANQSGLATNAGDIVYFETDSSSLTAEGRFVVEAQVRWLNNFPNTNVNVEGHADERGTREYNLALGDRRASAVKNYLIALGIDPRRINTISYGKEQPLVVGNGSQSWSQNRRAQTRVQ